MDLELIDLKHVSLSNYTNNWQCWCEVTAFMVSDTYTISFGDFHISQIKIRETYWLLPSTLCQTSTTLHGLTQNSPEIGVSTTLWICHWPGWPFYWYPYQLEYGGVYPRLGLYFKENMSELCYVLTDFIPEGYMCVGRHLHGVSIKCGVGIPCKGDSSLVDPNLGRNRLN